MKESWFICWPLQAHNEPISSSLFRKLVKVSWTDAKYSMDIFKLFNVPLTMYWKISDILTILIESLGRENCQIISPFSHKFHLTFIYFIKSEDALNNNICVTTFLTYKPEYQPNVSRSGPRLFFLLVLGTWTIFDFS